MATDARRALLEGRYYQAAQDYLRSLHPEHFMESAPQATQRKITLESLDLVSAARADVHVYNELLVQYPRKGKRKLGQVVPDNMVVVHDGPLNPEGSYDTPLQPAAPFWMLEYVSKSTKRKDYDDNLEKYERELKVPYYLLFQPDVRELTLYRHTGRKYVSVKPNAAERFAVRELELEVALLGGWVRFWLRGELVPLPADLQSELDHARRELAAEREARRAAEQRSEKAEEARSAAEEELGRLRAEVEQLKRRRNHK
jgi:Uma2 family endonuclease